MDDGDDHKYDIGSTGAPLRERANMKRVAAFAKTIMFADAERDVIKAASNLSDYVRGLANKHTIEVALIEAVDRLRKSNT